MLRYLGESEIVVPMKTTYIATAPDGTQIVRKTNKTYTHAVLSHDERGWLYMGFCASRELAEKLFNRVIEGDNDPRVLVELEVA